MTKPASASGSPGRLTKNYQYRQVYREGRLVRGKRLWLYLMPLPGGRAKVGVSISRSAVKKATARNKLDRIIREWFRQHTSSTDGSYEAVVVVKKAPLITKANLKSTKEELSYLYNDAVNQSGCAPKTIMTQPDCE